MFPRRNFHVYYTLLNKFSKYVKIKYYYGVQKYLICKKPNIDLSMRSQPQVEKFDILLLI